MMRARGSGSGCGVRIMRKTGEGYCACFVSFSFLLFPLIPLPPAPFTLGYLNLSSTLLFLSVFPSRFHVCLSDPRRSLRLAVYAAGLNATVRFLLSLLARPPPRPHACLPASSSSLHCRLLGPAFLLLLFLFPMASLCRLAPFARSAPSAASLSARRVRPTSSRFLSSTAPSFASSAGAPAGQAATASLASSPSIPVQESRERRAKAAASYTVTIDTSKPVGDFLSQDAVSVRPCRGCTRRARKSSG